MSYDDIEGIELYKKHKQECEQHILMDMTKIFDINDMLYAVMWKLTCDTIENNIPREKRKEYIYNIINKQLSKWV